MAYTRFYFGGPVVSTGRPLCYYLCDTAGDLPSSGLYAGELASTLDVAKLYVAVDSTTWRELTKASSTGYAATGMLGSGTADNTKYLRGDQSWQTPPGGGGGSAAVTAATITAPYNSLEYSETVADANVTTSSKIIAYMGQTTSNDENEPSMDALAVRASCEVDGSLILTVAGEAAFGGPIKLNYLIGG